LTALLELTDVTARYGPITALHGVSLRVDEGEIVALLGANGAGKTTTLRAISGLVRKTGAIEFAGRNSSGWSPERTARSGIAHVPEGRGILGELTVWENLRMGAYVRRNRAEIREDLKRSLDYFPWLEERRNQQAGTLSGGEQQIVAITRALMARPELLILDEPSMGLSPVLVKEIFKIIRRLREEGTTILLIEQNARAALHAADRGYVLETGRIILQGASQMLLEHNEVKRAYLGKGYREVWEE